MLFTEIPNYELKELISQRNKTKVYHAIHTPSDSEVTLKVKSFHPDIMHKGAIKRLLSEAKISANLDHVNIANLYDIGQHNNLHYFSMNRFQLGSLQEKLEQESNIPLEWTLDIILQLLSALKYTHGRGYIHRNIKPENIFFDDYHHAVLADFGIAKIKNHDHPEVLSDQYLNYYTAPEQAFSNHADARSDLYSLGVIFYELMTGKLIYDDSKDYLENIDSLQRSLLNHDLGALKPIINKLLSKDPDSRFQTANVLIDEIKALQYTSTQQANKKTIKKQPSKKHKLPFLASFLLLLLIPAFAVQKNQPNLADYNSFVPEHINTTPTKTGSKTDKLITTPVLAPALDVPVEIAETEFMDKRSAQPITKAAPDMHCILNLSSCKQKKPHQTKPLYDQSQQQKHSKD